MSLKKHWGCVDGREIFIYRIKNNNIIAEIMNYGAVLHSLKIRNKEGVFIDIVGGYNSLDGYVNGLYKHGATVGRCANRIKKGEFSIEGKLYQLTKNAGEHHIHGGFVGYHKRVWVVTAVSDNFIELYLKDTDNTEGYPGNAEVYVTYRVEENKFIIDTNVTADAPTIVNITNHSFFNLNGCDSSDIRNHTFRIFCDRIAVLDKENIPTGELSDVSGTQYDFTQKRKISLPQGDGYDTPYYFGDKKMKLMAEAYSPESGISMRLSADVPCMQFFTVENSKCSYQDKTGKKSTDYSWFCLEPQYVPNTPNNNFISNILFSGEKYSHKFIYEFF